MFHPRGKPGNYRVMNVIIETIQFGVVFGPAYEKSKNVFTQYVPKTVSKCIHSSICCCYGDGTKRIVIYSNNSRA